EDPVATPVAGVDHGAVGDPVHAQRALHAAQRDGHAGLASGLDAVLPRELAVADVVPVAMAEVDPVPVGGRHRSDAAADGVGVLQHDDALAVPPEARPSAPTPPA